MRHVAQILQIYTSLRYMKNCVINDAASRKLTLCNNHLWHILWFLFLQFLVVEIFLNITKLLAKIGREQIPLWPPKALAWAPPSLALVLQYFQIFGVGSIRIKFFIHQQLRACNNTMQVNETSLV